MMDTMDDVFGDFLSSKIFILTYITLSGCGCKYALSRMFVLIP